MGTLPRWGPPGAARRSPRDHCWVTGQSRTGTATFTASRAPATPRPPCSAPGRTRTSDPALIERPLSPLSHRCRASSPGIEPGSTRVNGPPHSPEMRGAPRSGRTESNRRPPGPWPGALPLRHTPFPPAGVEPATHPGQSRAACHLAHGGVVQCGVEPQSLGLQPSARPVELPDHCIAQSTGKESNLRLSLIGQPLDRRATGGCARVRGPHPGS